MGKRVIILGGGFGGVQAALDLAKKNVPGLEITLISSKPHFEYYPSIYRVATGHSALQVCIPLFEIFAGKKVEVVEDYITRVDLKAKLLYGGIGSPYSYDYLILALGSETGYFNIPGLPELSYGFKSISEALKLRQHLHTTLTPLPQQDPPIPNEQKTAAAHFVIVGGGPTGTELAGELVEYATHLATTQGYDPSFITVDLIEAAPRLLPILPPDLSEKVRQHLYTRGVNIFLNRTVIEEEVEQLLLKDMQMKTKTVIWTAGVKPNRLIAQIEGLELDKRGRVEVTKYLQAKGKVNNVFVIGDAANTPYSGMAQTACYDGSFVARHIFCKLTGRDVRPYRPKKPIYVIPVGPNWAAALWGNLRIYGRLAYFLRELADLRYLLGILSPIKALTVYSKHGVLSEECPVCTIDPKPVHK